MNKTEVAAELDCSTRQVEKYASEDRLGTIEYVRGKRGREAKYADAAVAGLKAELERERREVVGTAPQSHALQRAPSEQGMQALGQAIADALQGLPTRENGQFTGHESLADLNAKVLLTLKDAARLSSLSDAHLRAALNYGTLEGKIIGRGWKITPDALKAYVTKVLK